MTRWLALLAVVLLGLIWLEVGGAARFGRVVDLTTEERPAPSQRGGILDMHGDEALAKAAAQAASASSAPR